MKRITIRNITEETFNKIKAISKAENRSLNTEVLMLIELGLNEELRDSAISKSIINKELQVEIWRNLTSNWEDDRSTEEIISDIYEHRSN